MDWLSYMVNVMFNFLRKYQTVSQNDCSILHSPQQCRGAPAVISTLGRVSLFNLSHSRGSVAVSPSGFNLCFSNNVLSFQYIYLLFIYLILESVYSDLLSSFKFNLLLLLSCKSFIFYPINDLQIFSLELWVTSSFS